MTVIYVLVTAVSAAITLWLAVRGKNALKGFLSSSVAGVLGLFTLSNVPVFGAVVLNINLFTLFVSATMGLPGLIGLLLLRVISY